MVNTVTQKDMTSITNRFTVALQRAGLLRPNQEVYYTNGSTGVSATLEVKTVTGSDCEFVQASWLPRFTPKDDKRTQYKVVSAATEILLAVNRA